MSIEFPTPPGRIVWGNPAKPQIKKDQNTKQPVLRDGQQVQQWVFGVAYPKAEFDQFIRPFLEQEVNSVFPAGVPGNFSWKFKDGDGVDLQGKPYADREGYAGHYVLTISTEAFAPPIYKNEANGYRQLKANEIKTGDYVVVSLNVKANAPTNPTHTPGIYVNPKGIELIGYGQEILGASANPDEMFGGRTYQLPAGASAAPVASAATAAAPYTAPAAPAAPAAAPLPPPATDFVQNAGQPPVEPPAAPAAPPMEDLLP